MQRPLIAGLLAAAGAAAALVGVAAPASAAAPRQVLYVGGYGTGLASVIDPATGRDLNRIGDDNPQGVTGRIAFDAGTGRAYVATGNDLNVVDVAQSRIIKSIGLTFGPLGAALAPGGGRVYTANSAGKTVTVIDTTSYATVATIVVGRNPADIAVASDGGHAYAVAQELYADLGTVAVIDTATNTVTASIRVGRQPRSIAVAPDGSRAYVANMDDSTVSVVDLVANRIAATIGVGAQPTAVVASPDWARIYVSNYAGNSVSVIDTATNAIVERVPLAGHAHGVTIAPDGRRAYIGVEDGSGGLLVPFDLATNATGAPMRISRVPGSAVFVDVADPAGPAADLSVEPVAGDPPNTFRFDPSASGLVRIVSSALDTGDGFTYKSPVPSFFTHTYRAPGTYTASLTVTDAEGRAATVRKQVRAASPSRTFSLLALSNLRYVTAEDAGRKPLIPNRTAAGAWEKVRVSDLGGGDVALFAPVNNRYLTVDPATSKVVASAENAVPFEFVAGADGAFSLRYKATGRYVSTNFDRELTADRTAIGPWERFAGTVATDVSWGSVVRGLVCAEDGGRKPLIANRSVAGSWETYDLIDAGDGQVAIFAHAGYRFVTAEAGGAQPLIANRTAVGAWEKFKILFNPDDGTQSLLANANGRFVTAEAGGAQPLIANRTAIGPWERFKGLPQT
nr:hypothetical protein GCM10020063_083040 [Dactylosporangium thailandense]